jgi:hypothetical protein
MILMGALEEYLKDIDTVKKMRKDISGLKDELLDEVIKINGKERRIHSGENRAIKERKMEEIL